jgi:hypothetical protein
VGAALGGAESSVAGVVEGARDFADPAALASLIVEDDHGDLDHIDVPIFKPLSGVDLVFAIGCGLSPTHFGHRIPDPSGKTIIHSVVDEGVDDLGG